jgi:hypothetical protein
MTQAMSASATYRPLGNSGITNAVDTAGSVRSSAPALNNRRPPTPWAGLSSTAPPLTALRSRSSREKCPVDAILAVVCIASAVEDVPDSVTLMLDLEELSGLDSGSEAVEGKRDDALSWCENGFGDLDSSIFEEDFWGTGGNGSGMSRGGAGALRPRM